MKKYKIPGFPGYKITKIGQVWSERLGKFIKTQKTDRGYLNVVLNRDKKQHWRRVHRLMLETFVGPRPEGTEGCHKNDIKIDNRPENLYWGTHSENMKDAFRNGGRDTHGEKNSRAKLNTLQVRIIRRLIELNSLTQAEIGRIFNVGQTAISCIKLNKRWKRRIICTDGK